MGANHHIPKASDWQIHDAAANMSEHTPTPWRITPSVPSDGFECYWLTGNFGPHNAEKEICAINGPQSGVQAANAAFIVKAVNNHDALVRALRESAADIVCCCKDPDDPYVAEVLRRIADVLASVGNAVKP